MNFHPSFTFESKLSAVKMEYEYDDASLQNQSITGLISNLRSAFRKADFDRVEQVLVAKETQLKAEIGELQEKLEKEWLHRMDLEDKLKKCKDQCGSEEKNELNDGEDDTIAELRIKNRKLEDENRKLTERVLRLEKSEKMFMNGDTHVGAADSSPPRNDRESGNSRSPGTRSKDVLGASANGSRGWENVIDIADSDDNEFISGGTLNIGKEATSEIVASSNDNENPCLSVMKQKTRLMGVNDVNGKFKRLCVSQSPYGETDDDTSSTSSLLSRI